MRNQRNGLLRGAKKLDWTAQRKRVKTATTERLVTSLDSTETDLN